MSDELRDNDAGVRDRAWAASIEVDGRQAYLFETDKLQEMLGASRLLDGTVEEAGEICRKFGVNLFSPVSGEIRMWSEDLMQLLHASWTLREWLDDRGIEHTTAVRDYARKHFTEEGSADSDQVLDREAEPSNPSLAWVHRDLGREVERRKSAKQGADARPTCSQFASCQIHGTETANHWRPSHDGAGDPHWYAKEPRRWLVSARAKVKLKTWQNAKDELIAAYLGHDKSRYPHRFDDLQAMFENPAFSDRFIAFVCADADRMGELLSRIDWNTPRAGAPQPWERNHKFAVALNEATQSAFKAAIDDTIELWAAAAEKDGKSIPPLPVLPQLFGGDDLWMLCSREVALDVVTRFSKKFENAVRAPVHEALGSEPTEPLTMSVGVAMAKAGYPAHAMREVAESLLKNAKRLRRGGVWGREQPSGACMDWHIVESSLVESVAEARAGGFIYQDPPDDGDERSTQAVEVMLLTTTPWSFEALTAMQAAAREFKRVARRKREQLDDILRRGRTLSLLAWQAWWDGLTKAEQGALETAAERLTEAGIRLPPMPPEWRSGSGAPFDPWARLGDAGGRAVYWTPWLDLLAILDISAPQDGKE